MRKTISAIAAISLVAVVPAAAQAATSKQEKIGAGAGALIGAAAGGPPGLIIGAALGIYLGDNMHRKEAEIESLSADLTASRSEVLQLERDIGRMDQSLDTLSAEGYAPVGEPIWARYNPPFMPWFLRRNEILTAFRPTGGETASAPLPRMMP